MISTVIWGSSVKTLRTAILLWTVMLSTGGDVDGDTGFFDENTTYSDFHYAQCFFCVWQCIVALSPDNITQCGAPGKTQRTAIFTTYSNLSVLGDV